MRTWLARFEDGGTLTVEAVSKADALALLGDLEDRRLTAIAEIEVDGDDGDDEVVGEEE